MEKKVHTSLYTFFATSYSPRVKFLENVKLFQFKVKICQWSSAKAEGISQHQSYQHFIFPNNFWFRGQYLYRTYNLVQ